MTFTPGDFWLNLVLIELSNPHEILLIIWGLVISDKTCCLTFAVGIQVNIFDVLWCICAVYPSEFPLSRWTMISSIEILGKRECYVVPTLKRFKFMVTRRGISIAMSRFLMKLTSAAAGDRCASVAQVNELTVRANTNSWIITSLCQKIKIKQLAHVEHVNARDYSTNWDTPYTKYGRESANNCAAISREYIWLSMSSTVTWLRF